MRRLLISFLLLLLVGWSNVTAQAEEGGETGEATILAGHLDKIGRQVNAEGSKDLDAQLKQLLTVRGQISSCISRFEEDLSQVKADQALLGEPIAGEAATVAAKREELGKERLDRERRLSNCRLLLLRSDEMKNLIALKQQQWLQQTLFSRGPDLLSLLKENWSQPALWFNATIDFLTSSSGLERLSAQEYGVLALLALVAFLFSLRLRRWAQSWSEQRVVEATFASRFSVAFLAVFGRYAPQWLTSSTVAAYLYLSTYGEGGLPFITQVALGVPLYFLLLTLVYLFLAPRHATIRLIHIDSQLAAGLVRRFSVLMLVLFFGYLLFTTLLAQSLPESALLLARSFYSAALIFNLIWILWLVARIPQLQRVAWLKTFFTLLMGTALLAEWWGYRDLSAFIMRAQWGTLILAGIFWLASRLAREFFDSLAEGRLRWARGVRSLFGLRPEAAIPALGWMRVFVFLGLLLLFVFGLLRVWGVSEGTYAALVGSFTSGFHVGSLTVVPARIVIALTVFALLVFISGWLKARLISQWIDKVPMERGAREAMVTLAGYVGIALALLVALGVAGVEFSNLAIIAGALSVGIGFGLQNIVNNFVSGLILLFERPVKTGDWVVVGSTEGYVRKISIRSTQIQTFDRADVIVPNSDLISQQVTNWMLHDARGRIRIPIGVAYGSDVYLVRDLLLKICREHPLVINDGTSPLPKVLFRAFGESSLDFELRCHIGNIDSKLDVTSDLNFAINDLFREHNIEIPFPQRDLHIIGEPKAATPLSGRYQPTAHKVEPEQDNDADE